MPKEDFEYVSKIGSGSFSHVEKVKRKANGVIYAMKKVFFNTLSDREKEYALNEVRLLASVKDSHIISYNEAFFDSNVLCIVMEYADGGDLQSLISTHKKQNTMIPETTIWKIFYQIVKALRVLHNMRIVHRDLKTANVFLTKDNEVKIGDFNVSKVMQKAMLTTQRGTPYYMSPEIWKEQPCSIKSDIWSLGVILYEMCTLQMPFKASNIHSLYVKIIEGKLPKFPQHVSKGFITLISACLKQDPKKRPITSQILLMIPNIKEMQPQKYNSNITLEKTIKLQSDCSMIEKELPKPRYLKCLKEVRSCKKIRLTALRSNKSQQDIRDLSHPINTSEKPSVRNESPFPLKPVKHIIKRMHKLSEDASLNEITNCNHLLGPPSVSNMKCYEAKRLKIYLNCIPSVHSREQKCQRELSNDVITPSNRALPPLNLGMMSAKSDRCFDDIFTPLLNLKNEIRLIEEDK